MTRGNGAPEVLIAGAGPLGLILAITPGQRGIRTAARIVRAHLPVHAVAPAGRRGAADILKPHPRHAEFLAELMAVKNAT
jgi:2-polyprenyl-6-methoxyphenol hydroxylase-like FAD-dependent oxidoreductase